VEQGKTALIMVMMAMNDDMEYMINTKRVRLPCIISLIHRRLVALHKIHVRNFSVSLILEGWTDVNGILMSSIGRAR